MPADTLLPAAFPASRPPELQVDAIRMITVLKQRLLEEITKSAILETALAEAQEREHTLRMSLARQSVPGTVEDPQG
jgi:hypothetical protein